MLALSACSPPSQLRDLVGRDPASEGSPAPEELTHTAPEIPERPASLSFGALVHTNEASWSALLDKSVTTGGALVLDALPDTPAMEAGLQPGDVIAGLDGAPITNHEQLVTAFQLSGDGEHTLLVQKAGGDTESIVAQLEPAPEISLLTYLEQKVAETSSPIYRFLLADRVLDHERAIALYRELIVEFPDFAVAQSLLAKRLISQMEATAGDAGITSLGSTPQIEEARALINAAIESDPSAASIYRTRSQIYLSLDENAQAESDALTALEMDTGAAQAYFLVGTARLVQGRPDEALVALHEAVNLDPFVVQYYFNLALCFRELGFPEEAEQTVEAGKALVDDVTIRESLDGILQSA